MEIFDTIKSLCEDRGISVNELEKILDFGQGSIGKWKTSTPKMDKILKIANYFNVSVDYLTGRTNVRDGVYNIGISREDAERYYYINESTAEVAQDLKDKDGMRILFDAAKDSRPEDILMAAELLNRLKGTNPDG